MIRFRKQIGTLLLTGALLCAAFGCGGPAPQAISPSATAASAAEATAAATKQPERAPVEHPIEWNLRDNEPSGEAEQRNDKAVIDYSHTAQGYVMAQRLVESELTFKVQVVKDDVTYTYNLPDTEWNAFPLSEGDGHYTVTVYENTSGSKYAQVASVSFDVTMDSEFEPFLRPSQYVNYMIALDALKKSSILDKQIDDTKTLEKVDYIYRYIADNLHYDKARAASVKSGYVPDIADVLSKKSGICFDYASLMTSMLRLWNVPCKMVFGYVGEAYHAWISVYTEEEGWVDAIWFDGMTWHRMDPTFASAGSTDASIRQYIGNGKNYEEKYVY